MSVSKRLRWEILRRDGYRCRYCGKTSADERIEVDHVIPKALGGTDHPTNLTAACHTCNKGKNSTAPDDSLVADVAKDADRWQSVRDEVSGKTTSNGSLIAAFNDSWPEEMWRPRDWANSVAIWLNRGLPLEALIGFIPRARAAINPWEYLCGCAWKRIRSYDDKTEQAYHDNTEQAYPDHRIALKELVLLAIISGAHSERHLARCLGEKHLSVDDRLGLCLADDVRLCLAELENDGLIMCSKYTHPRAGVSEYWAVNRRLAVKRLLEGGAAA